MKEIREYLRRGKRCLTPEILNIFRTYDFVIFDGHKIETDRLIKRFLCEIVQDTGKGYKRLKVAKRD
jgi:hypothetical protein